MRVYQIEEDPQIYSMSTPAERKRHNRLKALEEGFDLKAKVGVRMRSEYNALHDPNMRHYFESKNVQGLLYASGQIDKHGRVIDLDRQQAKLNILEREFRAAQRIEERRQQDEMDMRYRVQKKRFEELERMRKEEAILRIKQQGEIGKNIVSIIVGRTDGRGSVGGSRTESFGSSFFQKERTGASGGGRDTQGGAGIKFAS